MNRFHRLSGVLILCALATEAQAHLVGDAFSPFYGGLVHPLVSPQDVMAVLGLGLLAGLSGPAAGRSLLVILPLAWMCGMCCAPSCTIPDPPGILLTILVGILVATDRPWSPVLIGILVGLVGILHGIGNGQDLMPVPGRLLATIGTICAVAMTCALVAGQGVSMKRPWMRICMRVMGSWLAAIGLLMLGWSLRG